MPKSKLASNEKQSTEKAKESASKVGGKPRDGKAEEDSASKSLLGKRDADGNLVEKSGPKNPELESQHQSESSQNREDDDESQENNIQSRGIGKSRVRRPKTILDTEKANAKAQAHAQASQQKQEAMKKAKKKETKDTTVGKSTGALMTSAFPVEVSKRFLYKPFTLLPDLTDLIGKTIEVRVHKVYLTKFNKAVQLHQFYGNDNYSSDSDIVCILQHQGKINLSDQQPDGYEAVAVYFKVAKAKNSYPS